MMLHFKEDKVNTLPYAITEENWLFHYRCTTKNGILVISFLRLLTLLSLQEKSNSYDCHKSSTWTIHTTFKKQSKFHSINKV